MKQKNGGIKRLLEFTGEKRSLLNISRILSGVSAIFILGPFLCVYFAARELVNVFTGSALDPAPSGFAPIGFFLPEQQRQTAENH